MKNFSLVFALFCAMFLFAACGDGTTKIINEQNTDDSTAETNDDSEKQGDENQDRKQGELYGECYPNKTCNDGLECDVENNVCIKDNATDNKDSDNADATDSDNDSNDSNSDNDSGDTSNDADNDYIENTDDENQGKKQGELYGECYPNKTCNYGLECDAENNICIKDNANNDGDVNPDNDAEIADSDNDPDDSTSDDDTDTNDSDNDSDYSVPDNDTNTEPIDPCVPNPCIGIENSTKICTIFGNIHTCECKQNYYWDGSVCGTVQTQTASCTGLPDNAEWNTVNSIIQTWNEYFGTWVPTSIGSYNENPSTNQCRYKCKENYRWKNSKCVVSTCTPGETRECYEGPSGTEGVGVCKSGIATCVEDENDVSEWSECVGQVLPKAEICSDGIDQNCDGSDMTPENAVDYDGDGYNYCTGDCCESVWDPACSGTDSPERINPGAYEMRDNYVDDNCNGQVDEVEHCDAGLSLSIGDYAGNAEKLAKAMGACAGLVSAELSLAGEPVTEQIDTNPNACNQGEDQGCQYNPTARQSREMPYYESDYQTFAVTNMFGTQMTPLEGNMLAVLSTGQWNSPTMNGQIATLATGDMQTASKIPEDWINMMPGCAVPKAPSCGGQAPQEGLTNQCSGKGIPVGQDPIMLTLKMKVPANARAFEFSLFFISIEYPGTVCSNNNFNDFFVALLDSTYNENNPNAEYKNPYDKNLAKDEFGNPVGVDLAPAGLFKACNPNCGSGGPIGGMTNSINKWGACTGDELLNGTGFGTEGQSGIVACSSGHGGTGWLRVVGNVEPNETITLRLALWEQGEVAYGPDHSYDSTVVLDGFTWLPTPKKPGIKPN